MGYTIEASASSQLIEIRRVDGLPVGTTIEVEMSSESVQGLELESDDYSRFNGLTGKVNWFCWDWPKVIQRVIRGSEPELLKQEDTCPVGKSNLPSDWAVIRPKGFEAVFWTFQDEPALSCNGLRIAEPEYSLRDSGFDWPEHAQLRRPSIAVLDGAANLPLTIQRYRLSQPLPFVDELVRDVSLSFIAHALVCGPNSTEEALSTRTEHPLKLSQFSSHSWQPSFAEGLLSWCATSETMVPADPWLYTLLGSDSCLLYGALRLGEPSPDELRVPADLLRQARTDGFAILPWYGRRLARDSYRWTLVGEAGNLLSAIFRRIGREGVPCLRSVAGTHVLVCARPGYQFQPEMFSMENDEDPDYPPSDWFQALTGALNGAVPLGSFLKACEDFVRTERKRPRRGLHSYDEAGEDRVIFSFAEVRTRPTNSPESMIAKIWHECLGAKAIPFDPAAREALIAEGSKHAELKRHIDAWKEMKRTGSKWVTSGWKDQD